MHRPCARVKSIGVRAAGGTGFRPRGTLAAGSSGSPSPGKERPRPINGQNRRERERARANERTKSELIASYAWKVAADDDDNDVIRVSQMHASSKLCEN